MHAVADAPLSDVTVELPAGAPTLEQILALERQLQAHPEVQIDMHVEHFFAPGIYARELHIPAGVVLTGKVHRHEHFNVCCGDILVWTEDGMKRLTGYHRLVSKPGTKRVGFALGPTVWTTFHHNPTDTQDLVAIEAEHIIPEALAAPKEYQCLG